MTPEDVGAFTSAVFVLAYAAACGRCLFGLSWRREWQRWSLFPLPMLPVVAALVAALAVASASIVGSVGYGLGYAARSLMAEVWR